MTDAEGAVLVTENPAERRYELTLGGTMVGFLAYKDRGRGRRVLVHTEIESAYGGRGLGGALIQAALDDARSRNLTVVPVCPFVTAFVRRHPEYLDLVDEPHRSELTTDA